MKYCDHEPGEHPYRAADADGKEQREGGVMLSFMFGVAIGIVLGTSYWVWGRWIYGKWWWELND
jgi:hypothetical protein